MRLNRFLASRGVGSRRTCDEFIRQGHVQVNGHVVLEPWFQVERERHTVHVNGRRIEAKRRLVYIVLNKPAGYVVTARDPQRRPTVFDLIQGVRERIFSVGRLDADTEGLLLLTNDGDVSYRVAHPRFGVEKVYRVLVSGKPGREALASIRTGLGLDDGRTAPAHATVVGGDEKTTCVEMRMHEGRKRQIKRMWAALGHPVVRLVRTRFAGLTLRGLDCGEWRHLTAEEIGRLRANVGLGSERIPQ